MRNKGIVVAAGLIMFFVLSCSFVNEINCHFKDGTWITSSFAKDEPGYFEPFCEPWKPTTDDEEDKEFYMSDIRFIPADVRKASRPPDVIAYANVEYVSPPATVDIQSHGKLWTYNANIALVEKGDWISATCANPETTAIGVRLEGDNNDGWVAIQVDGEEFWRGSVYGDMNSDAGMFLAYAEVYGLDPGPHTIRLENLGIQGPEGGDDVAMRYFGCSTRPVSTH